jgi:O-antigen chain-terminating methyltransferase
MNDPANARRNPPGEASDADAVNPEPGGPLEATAARAQLNSYKYVSFEDQFRGPQDEIRARLTVYAPIFRGASDVLDIGCGRGEFLDVLREAGVSARGVDSNHEMADTCHDRGLQATAGDALQYLSAQDDESLGGIFAAQVVEHLPPDYLLQLLELGYRKLRPGSRIILETINPACWHAFFSSYLRDVTHAQPLHPETLQHFLTASGFQAVDIRYSMPVPESLKLQPIRWATSGVDNGPAQAEAANPLREAGAIVNDNMAKLNGFLFSYMDYAVIGERR